MEEKKDITQRPRGPREKVKTRGENSLGVSESGAPIFTRWGNVVRGIGKKIQRATLDWCVTANEGSFR